MGEKLPSKSEKVPMVVGEVKERAAADRRRLSIKIDAQFDPSKFKDDYNTFYPNGEFTQEEKSARTQELAPGLIVRHDVGLDFYLVQEGDTLDGIKDKLAKFDIFAYMRDLPKGKIRTFNIPAKLLQPGMWLVLPPKKSPVEGLTDEQFVSDCRMAIDGIKTNPIYGRFVVELLKKTKVDEVVAMMLACAKTESGSGAYDQFALFRYQDAHKCYSYTLFHILMSGAGLKARQNLGMTEGQILQPKNSVKLFLAFMIEKAPNSFHKLFPLEGKTQQFATFYNGNWKLAAKLENGRIDERNKKKKKGEKFEPPAVDYPTRLGQNFARAKAILRI